MNILVSNDDGINAMGIRVLISALAAIDGVNVYVCAPDGERSAASHSISTTTGPIIIKEMDVPGAVMACTLSGTPADCTKFGIKRLRNAYGIEMDAVFSGINHGGNLGSDVYYSGTASAAMEGNLCRVPSVSFSIDKSRPTLEMLENMTGVIQQMVEKALPAIDYRTMINVNFPGIPPEEVRGVKVTRLGPREYNEKFDIYTNPRKQKYFWYSGDVVRYEKLPPDLDIMAHQAGYATVTPLKLDLTDIDMMEKVASWDITVQK